jgi:hypothetical protein
VLGRDVAAELGLADHGGEEAVGDLVAEQALPVLGERREVEGGASIGRSRNHLNSRS